MIPDAELALTFVRSSGPGGQNVNKVASAVQLRFDLAGSIVLPEPVKVTSARSGRPPIDRRRRHSHHRAQPPQPGTESPRCDGASRGADPARPVAPKTRTQRNQHALRAKERLATKDQAAAHEEPARQGELGRVTPCSPVVDLSGVPGACHAFTGGDASRLCLHQLP